MSAPLVGRCQEKPLLGEKPFLSSFASGKPVVLGKTCLLFGAHRGRSLFLVVYSPPILGRFLCRKNPFGKKPLSCWEKSLDSLLVLYQSSGDFCGFSRSLCSAGRLLFSTLLGEISAPLVGLRKLSAPSLFSLVLVGVCILFSRCNFLDKDPFLGKTYFVGKPMVG